MILSGIVLRRLLLASYTAFILWGSIRIGFGAIDLIIKPKIEESDKVEEFNEVDTFENDRWTSIVFGLVSLLIGILGLVAVLLNRRAMLMAIISFLAVAIVMDVILLVVAFTATKSLSRVNKNAIEEKIVNQFGKEDSASKKFTWSIENYQKREKCCGFSDNAEENLFLRTPWYKQANANSTAGKKNVTLPLSCCLGMTSKEKCRVAVNMKEARINRYVFEKDCLTKISDGLWFNLWSNLVWSVFGSCIKAFCLAATMTRLLSPAE
uniref:Tetraspanin n=1 Tax=Macrostomum lignano TaxID=282301 RepID=A0A1I8HRS1_9PLAT